MANFGELDAALAPLHCLHKMLHATAPRVFPLKARIYVCMLQIRVHVAYTCACCMRMRVRICMCMHMCMHM